TLMIALSLLLLSLPVLAQNDQRPETLLDLASPIPNDETGMSIHLMPLSFANSAPRIRLGVQYKKKRFSYLLDLEYGRDNIRPFFKDNADPVYRFYGFRPELRYHLNWGDRSPYVGLELPFTLKYDEHRGNLVAEDNNVYNVEAALERRLRFSAILKVGQQLVALRHLFVDGYVGAGAAYRNLRYTDLVNPGPPTEQPMEWGCCELKEHGGDIKAELALGLRLGYWFSR
ncbi:MAG: hypothetical protein ACI9G6_003310, partial [Limisphaerales bacterium]